MTGEHAPFLTCPALSFYDCTPWDLSGVLKTSRFGENEIIPVEEIEQKVEKKQ